MSDSQITNGQRAAHALHGINAHARSSAGLEHGIREEYFFFDDEREAEPGADQARLANLLRDLRHYADRRGLSFDGALSTARRDYERQRTAYQPGDAIRLAGNSRDAAAAEGFPRSERSSRPGPAACRNTRWNSSSNGSGSRSRTWRQHRDSRPLPPGSARSAQRA